MIISFETLSLEEIDSLLYLVLLCRIFPTEFPIDIILKFKCKLSYLFAFFAKKMNAI